MVSRMVNAESRITQNANNIALKVSTSTYNTEKVYRGSTAPTTLYTNMLWLDTSATPNLLKRYTGSAWVAAGAQEVKSSGIYIGPNNVAITTENFLLQLLDPANNENVLMEMSANGNVGFKQLYADEVVSNSVASAYGGPIALHVNTSYSGASDTYFRSLGDAVKAVNNRFLRSDVYIYLPNGTGEIYEPAGTQIQGVSGSGKLIIYGYANSRLNSFISVKGCSAHICFQNVSLREIRTLNGSNRNPYLIDLQMNHHVEMNSCTLDANNVTYDSIYCRTTHVYLYNCGLYNALQGLEVYMGWAYMQNCKGSCSWSMVSYAGYIICSGSVPSGSRNQRQQRTDLRYGRDHRLRNSHPGGYAGQHGAALCDNDQILSRRLALGYAGRDSGRVFRQRIQIVPQLELRLYVVRQPALHAVGHDDQVGDIDVEPQDGQRLRQRKNAVPVRHHQCVAQRLSRHRGQLWSHWHHWAR